MAQDESKRLPPAIVAADRTSLSALQTVANYTPANPAFSLTALNDALASLNDAKAAEDRASAAAAAARDNAVKREWAFHNLILGMRDQVVAQFGKDSNEVQAVGLKKASEYKRPGRKAPPPTT